MVEPTEIAARIVLAGSRFDGGRLPVNSLVEVQRYQAILIAAARQAWSEAHPGEPPPTDFNDSLELSITEVQEGSATLLMERTQEHHYDEFFDDAIREFEAELSIATNPESVVAALQEAPNDPNFSARFPLIQMEEFLELGSTLEGEDTLTLGGAERRIEITPSVRDNVIVPFATRVKELLPSALAPLPPERRTVQGSIAGRLIAVNADRRNFTLNTLAYGRVNGRYKTISLLDDLKRVLDSSSTAQVVRVEGQLRFVGDRLERILNMDLIEVFDVPDAQWAGRLLDLAALPMWWMDGIEGEMISFAALDAAARLLSKVDEWQGPRPGIFPMATGGVHLEWASPERVSSVEISAYPDYELFDLDVASGIPVTDETTQDAESALTFLAGLFNAGLIE